MTKSSLLSAFQNDLQNLRCDKTGIKIKLYDIVSNALVASPAPWQIAGDVQGRKRMILVFLNERISYGVLSHEYEVGDQLMVYVEKVDSCGFGSPIQFGKNLSGGPVESTSLLKETIQSYLKHLVSDWSGSVSVHVFARSQPEFLFNGSEKLPCKNILSHSNLIKWWKEVLSFDMSGYSVDRKIYVPNGECSNFIQGSDWKWEFPYSGSEVITKCIPLFPDDAKARLVRERLEDGSAEGLTVKEFTEYLDICQDFCNGNMAAFLRVGFEGKSEVNKIAERSSVLAANERDAVAILNDKLNEFMFDSESLVEKSSLGLIDGTEPVFAEWEVPFCDNIEKKKVAQTAVVKTINVVSSLIKRKSSTLPTAKDDQKKQKV
jgi:hypothetical protein